MRAVAGVTVKVSAKDVVQARKLREQQLQAAVGTRRVTVKRLTPKFTGNWESDFRGAEIIRFQKTEDTVVRSAAAWDEQNLYLAWDVRDKTPWTNGAQQPENLYLSGDTVDFQLASDAQANPKRDKAALGDLRLSIGNFQGAPRPCSIARSRRPSTR